tara:strand:+ start:53 stop:1120 length:1068 start_codon:yes stop_codon:yes gene_type:complete
MVSSFGPGIDGKIMRELLPKVTKLCSGRAFLQREGHMSKEEHLLDRRTDITDDLYYPETYKIGMNARAELYEHDAIANPYLNAAARIITRFVRKVAAIRHQRNLRYMDYLQLREDGTYTRADEEFVSSVRELDLNLPPHLELNSKQKDWCNSVWEQERRTVARSNLLDHICCMQDVHVHLNTCRWSKRAWSLETWGADEKPFCMSLNQAIRQNKNTNLTAMYVYGSYDEWEIDIAWQVAQEVVWKCEDDNKSYWTYIEDHFEGSEKLFNEWVEEQEKKAQRQRAYNEWMHPDGSPGTPLSVYDDIDSDIDSEPWGTPEQMEMFTCKEELYEYLDAMMDEQDRALEDAQFRMECDW